MRCPACLMLLLALAACTGFERAESGAMLTAFPNPVVVCDGTGLARVRMAWFREGMSWVQLRVGSPDGSLLAIGPSHGDQWTGKWVHDGAVFYVVDAATGDVLAQTTVEVRRDCD